MPRSATVHVDTDEVAGVVVGGADVLVVVAATVEVVAVDLAWP